MPTKKKPAPATLVDVSAFPPDTATEHSRFICLACVLDVFTRHMGLSATTAQREMKKYQPGLAELTAAQPVRPYFDAPGAGDVCPYCASPAKWHARLAVFRIEGGKATDKARRELVKQLPTAKGEFEFLEEKSTGRDAFYQWLERVGGELNFESDDWLIEASRLYLARREPKVDWENEFRAVRQVRRSRQLEEGWESQGFRLFLSPMLFDELLLVQYLLSRSHKAGGLTFEGRKTLPELVLRLRHSGYLRHQEVNVRDTGDVLEQLLEHLSGGDASVKFHYIVDRRDFLEKLASLKDARVPKPKLAAATGAGR